jgi:hypothetical protein
VIPEPPIEQIEWPIDRIAREHWERIDRAREAEARAMEELADVMEMLADPGVCVEGEVDQRGKELADAGTEHDWD